jgi:5-methylcytosine-specific restriction endonuclease McrA
MRADMFNHFSDSALIGHRPAVTAQKRATDATFLAWVGEVDARKLYLPQGHPSMLVYCVHALNQTEDVALKYIRAARVARQFPEIFQALAVGRMNLSGVIVLKPHLNQQNVEELLKAAELKTRAQIELLIAERFPRSEVLPLVCALPNAQVAPGPPEGVEIAPAYVREFKESLAPGPPFTTAARSKVAPLSARSYELRVTIGADTHEMLRHAQDLLGHRVRSDDIDEVLRRALKELVGKLEKQKFGATTRPQAKRRSNSNPRHIPAHVKRAVYERDGGQCTFIGKSGQRCPARQDLEYDHVTPVARGGQATVENVRLRCRSHNQYEADRTFGAGFMDEKREAARRLAEAERRAKSDTGVESEFAKAEATRVAAAEERVRVAAEEERARAVLEEQAKDVMAGLRGLGFRAQQARRAAEYCTTLPDATLEERLRAALRFLCPKTQFNGRVGTLPAPA